MEVKKVKKLYKLLAKKLHKRRFHLLLLAGIFFSCLAMLIGVGSIVSAKDKKGNSVLGIRISKIEGAAKEGLISPVVEITLAPIQKVIPTPTNSPTPSPIPTIPLPTLTPTKVLSKANQGTNLSQYTAQKINDVTWRVVNTINDGTMASAQDILNALNSYRGSHGFRNLSWNQKLADYAQSRADLFAKNGSLDSHAGFTNFMANGGFDKTGYNGLGENSAFLSGPMNADHIIRNIFGADSAHDGNQLDPSWTNVGIGVNGVAINVNFGKNPK